MRIALLPLLLCSVAASQSGEIVREVRAAVENQDFASAEAQVRTYRAAHGDTPEALEAFSWLGRGALASRQLDRAEDFAKQTRKLVLAQLKRRKLDDEKRLPAALGAAIEVQAQVLKARGQRAEAVAFLEQELAQWRATSIRTRIQKNINLLSLEGKPAPPLEMTRVLGSKPAPATGRPRLLFFWAHWCGDCKGEVPVLARISSRFGPHGLELIGPTQRYGYVAGGEEAPPEAELRYIDEVRQRYYAPLSGMPVPVSEENFRTYGASTTPTLVLVDANDIVRLYHPGAITYELLAAKIQALLENGKRKR